MNQNVTITEILSRSDQGMTRPFLCRADDGGLYYVKGRYAGLRSLCCEWVAGNLARVFGMPVPEFVIAEVPSHLVEGSERPDVRDLGAGPVFASSRLENAREITWQETKDWHIDGRARVLLFDWLVKNEDRSLSALGGNPNLLITAEQEGGWDEDGRTKERAYYHQCLWTFDFNLAFDPDFDAERFLGGHIFANTFIPEAIRAEFETRLPAALVELPRIFDRMPVEWLHMDGDESLPVQLDQNEVYSILKRRLTDLDAWGLTL